MAEEKKLNKIVTIDQLKKFAEDYFTHITKKKILDYVLTVDEVDSGIYSYLKINENDMSDIRNLNDTLKDLEGDKWTADTEDAKTESDGWGTNGEFDEDDSSFDNWFDLRDDSSEDSSGEIEESEETTK